ncbi:phosphotransferase [Photobacterium kagoshimensis]|uniref:phosphotransferase n=1 Tax=Photobacterium kagoshimensis TaxID=2910242 RepID=UPI003D10808F
MSISQQLLSSVAQFSRASSVSHTQIIQTLWGGYGTLFRAYLNGAEIPSVVVKYIELPQPKSHPKGWNTVTSHQRKLDSYQVEVNWYQSFANKSHNGCFVPHCVYVERLDNAILLILDDLTPAGYSEVVISARQEHVEACLSWLAFFHAQHLHPVHSSSTQYSALWSSGTYWHLATRPDELNALQDQRLKQAASLIDQTLNDAQYQTLVHGDAKLANFCFTPEGTKAAAVDFQYVGQGCGMKDVILLLSSVLDFTKAEVQAPTYLDYYFAQLSKALAALQPHLNAQSVEQEWRDLYPVAWADFQRFVKGWSPAHWKINDYTEALTVQALDQLGA